MVMISLEVMRNKLEMYIEDRLFRIILKMLKLLVWFMKRDERKNNQIKTRI